MTASGKAPNPNVYFTAPWEPLVMRRGDALGLRALADVFADAVAPDLNNNISDGRWITILSWCLVRADLAFRKSGRQERDSRTEQAIRYAWLRPLELMHVARAIEFSTDPTRPGRQLPGQLRVRQWMQDGTKRDNQFGMSDEQFAGYRQTGIYGSYRLAFRRLPGLSEPDPLFPKLGNGWIPGPAARALSKRYDKLLGKNGWKLPREGDEKAPNIKPTHAKEVRWWRGQWPQFKQGSISWARKTLPRQKSDHSVLPEAELIRPLLFGDSGNLERRRIVAKACATGPRSTHQRICENLAKKIPADPTVQALPAFAQLADEGILLMRRIEELLKYSGSMSLDQLAEDRLIAARCTKLKEAAARWSQNRTIIAHRESADSFATAVNKKGVQQCLEALVRHHETRGSGLRWFVLRDGKVELRTPPSESASMYRFRLWSLCRLAVQCGEIKDMPKGLLAIEADAAGGDDDE